MNDDVATAERAVSLATIEQARTRLGSQIVHTPTNKSETLSLRTGSELWLKFENQQFTASFKDRGALNKLLCLSETERRQGVIAASAGNHAQAVAHHSRRLGIAATIVMPVSAPFAKVSNTLALGADVVQFGQTVDASNEHALELARARGLVRVHPFDDPDVIAGQGTLALELLADAPNLDAVVVPVGGGGLISGVATVCKALAPNLKVIGVQTELFRRAADSFRQRREALIDSDPSGDSEASAAKVPPSLGPFGADTLADGIAVKSPSPLTQSLIDALVDDMLTVDESSLEHACNDLLEFEKTVAEGAGAAALAAVIQHPDYFAGRRVACIVSGGNMDPRVMADTILRGLARSGRLARLRVDVRDLPGSLAEITRVVAETGANIVDVRHERVFLATPAMRTRLSLELATRNDEHAEAVARALRSAGHAVLRILG
ncbi:MAG TPA: pyridoxal-phosphate dependent enzyme [Polyangiaceae bacterium]|jgi:threonine dehydratase|nr:pyridoxal-phosphate dependent enzyme [Polyangiaceae bacterium]